MEHCMLNTSIVIQSDTSDVKVSI